MYIFKVKSNDYCVTLNIKPASRVLSTSKSRCWLPFFE